LSEPHTLTETCFFWRFFLKECFGDARFTLASLILTKSLMNILNCRAFLIELRGCWFHWGFHSSATCRSCIALLSIGTLRVRWHILPEDLARRALILLEWWLLLSSSAFFFAALSIAENATPVIYISGLHLLWNSSHHSLAILAEVLYVEAPTTVLTHIAMAVTIDETSSLLVHLHQLHDWSLEIHFNLLVVLMGQSQWLLV